ncbi:PepSY-associated TM helix domain-containing protein [Pedobacter nototheniae]|uniref:PepSY-associated TM helix domain-containing protein n=1 Tax=Pedobacter nototheniae TaxID=2488994 RepID=UPI00292DB64F|nr:PepSY-associated TM helix domain-containing protein [Pedobacter nototheniae]
MLRLDFKKTIALLHLWLGLISGLVVFILGITGSIYAFSDELKELFYKDRLWVEVPANQKKLPFEKVIAVAEAALGKDHKISRAELSNEPGRTYMFRALKVNKDGIGYWNYYTYYYKAYINPYTGELVKLENTKQEFFTVILAAHMNLLLGDKIGHQIVRYCVICFVLLLISGLILWWPKNRKAAKNSLSIKFSAKFKRLNYDLHNVLGFYAAAMLIMISLTGLAWSFGLVSEKKSRVQSDTTFASGNTPHQEIFTKTNALSPKAAYLLYNFPSQKSGTVNISAYMSNKHLYEKTQYKYDRYSGKLLEKGAPFAKLNPLSKLKALNYDLHTGSAIGFPGKILACLASLIAASLPITGFLFYVFKKKPLQKSARRNN